MSKIKTLILLASSSLMLAGCSTPQSMDYQPGISVGTERVGQTPEAEIALDPFVDRERTKKFFGIDAMDNGIAILHVRIVNKTANQTLDRKSTRLNSSHLGISYAVFCLKK